MSKLFIVQAKLIDGEYLTKIQEIEVIKETEKQFKVKGINRAQINKSDLNHISSGWAQNDNSRIRYQAFCLDEHKETVLNQCIERVRFEALFFHSLIDQNIKALIKAGMLSGDY